MNNNIKAIFFDIDGTLVSFNTHQVPQSTIDCLDRLRHAGIRLFIASGRHMVSINNLGNLHFDGYVTINGAMAIVDNKVIHRSLISHDALHRINNFMASRHPFPCTFVLTDRLVINYYNDVVDNVLSQLNFPRLPEDDLTRFENDDVYQLISFFSEDEEPEIMQCLPDCDAARWSPLFTDIVPKGTSKVIGIQKICQHFGISQDEIMAFGDGGNDIDMLRFASIGVAMGNATDNVKAAADYVTSSVDADGISLAIRHLLNI